MKFQNVFLKSIGIFNTFNVVIGYQIQYKFHCFEDYNSICKEYENNLISITNGFKERRILSRNVNFEIFVDNLMDNGISQNVTSINLDSKFKSYTSGERYPNYKKMSKMIENEKSIENIIIFDNYKYKQNELKDGIFSLYNKIYSHWKYTLPEINAFNYDGYIEELEEKIFPNNSLFNKIGKLMSKNPVTKRIYDNLVKSYDVNFLQMLYDNEQNLYIPKPEPVHWNNTLISKVDDYKQLTDGFDRIVAFGDIHGDYNKLIKVLTASKLIDKKLNWIAKNTALIQLGDLMDRGNDIKKILDLMIKLKKQAHHYKSIIYMVMGNHEAMNIGGRLDYVTLSELISFGSVKNREELFSLKGKYGSLIRKEMKAIWIVGDSLFVHAGLLSYHLTNTNVDEINNHFHEILANATTYPSHYTFEELYSQPVFIDPYFDDGGPIWTRALYEGPAYSICNDLAKTLELTKTKRMFVGHTVQEDGQIHTRCDNQLYFIDVGMSIAYTNSMAYIEMNKKGEIWAKYD